MSQGGVRQFVMGVIRRIVFRNGDREPPATPGIADLARLSDPVPTMHRHMYVDLRTTPPETQ